LYDIILATIVLIAVIGTIAYNFIYGTRNSEDSAEWWGKILLTIVGGLLLYLGINSNDENKK